MKGETGMWLSAGLVVILFWQAADVLAQGCAMCGTTVPDNGQAAAAFNGSILFMVAMPYILFAGITGWIVYKHRSHKTRG